MDLRELAEDGGRSRHPWESARARYFSRLLARRLPVGRPVRVLDVGAGDGYLASQLIASLPEGSTIVCFDSRYTDEHLDRLGRGADSRSLTYVRQLHSGRFDVLLFLDVLEHIDDERGMLSTCVAQRLKDD